MPYKDPDYRKKWADTHRDIMRQYQREYKQRVRATPEGRAKLNRDCRDSQQRLKLQVLEAYGGRHCACPSGQCFEDRLEFLTIDHINRDGSKHRKEIGGSSRLLGWLRQNKFLPGFRVLCFNCNMAMGKRNNKTGRCPHEDGLFSE